MNEDDHARETANMAERLGERSQAFLESLAVDSAAIVKTLLAIVKHIMAQVGPENAPGAGDVLTAQDALRAQSGLLLTLTLSGADGRLADLYEVGCEALVASKRSQRLQSGNVGGEYATVIARLAMAFAHCVRVPTDIKRFDDMNKCLTSIRQALLNADGPPMPIDEFKPLINALADNALLQDAELLESNLRSLRIEFARLRTDGSLAGAEWMNETEYSHWMDAMELVAEGLLSCLRKRNEIQKLPTSRLSRLVNTKRK
jgi:hypothetical protein